MTKLRAVLLVLAVSAFVLAVGQVAAAKPAGIKTVTVAMHDPGCHWFSVGGKYTKTLAVRGPVALANADEATLKVVGPKGARLDAVGKKIVLSSGTYKITMVGQAPDDNTLKLVVK